MKQTAAHPTTARGRNWPFRVFGGTVTLTLVTLLLLAGGGNPRARGHETAALRGALLQRGIAD